MRLGRFFSSVWVSGLALTLLAIGPVVGSALAQGTTPQLELVTHHTSRVTCLQKSPDGKLLASGALDGTSKIWGASPQKLKFSLPQGAPVLALTFAGPETLLTLGADQSLRVWNANTGALNAHRIYGAGRATAAALSADGALAAWGFEDGGLLVRDIKSGQTSKLAGHPTKILALAFAPDGKTLASTSDAYQEKPAGEAFARRSGDLRLWDVADRELIKTLVGHALAVRAVAWAPDGARLATTGSSGTVVLWNFQTLKREREINISLGKGPALAVAFSNSGTSLYASWAGGIVSVSDYRDEKSQAEMVIKPPSRMSLKIGTERRRGPVPGRFLEQAEPPIATSLLFEDGLIIGTRIGEVDSYRGPRDFARTPRITALRMTPDGSSLVTADSIGIVCYWDTLAGNLKTAWLADGRGILDLAIAPNGAKLAVTGGTELSLWSMSTFTQSPVSLLGYDFLTWEGWSKVAFTSGGGHLVGTQRPLAWLRIGGTPSDAERAQAFDLRVMNIGSRQIETLYKASSPIRSLTPGPDGSIALVTGFGSKAGEIIRLDSTGKLITREYLRGARSVSFSPDGKRLVAGGAFLDENQDYDEAGDALKVWNLRANQLVLELQAGGQDAAVLSSAYSADGSLFATGSQDGDIRIWDLSQEKRLLRTLVGNQGPVLHLVFGVGEGRQDMLYSAGQDLAVRCWNAKTGKPIATMVAWHAGQRGPGVNADIPAVPGTYRGGAVEYDWVTLTPEGYFIGSPGADRALNFRLGQDLFPVSAFAAGYRKSERVAAALRGELLAPTEFVGGAAVPPQVAIVMPRSGDSSTQPLRLQVAATDDKRLASVQIQINGRTVTTRPINEDGKPLEVGAKPLELGAKPLELGAKPLEVGAKPLEVGAKPLDIGAKPLEVGAKPLPAAHGRTWSLALEAPLSGGDGKTLAVKAIVTDTDGLQATDEIRLQRAGPAAATGTLYVLAVGVSKYANATYNLKFAAKDATAFGQLWRGEAGKIYREVQLTTLVDEAATAPKVAGALQTLARQAGSDDTVALFLSGHGVQQSATEFYFASHEVDLQNLPATAVPWTLFQSSLASSAARRIVMYLDACHSGAALGGSQAANETLATSLVQGAGAVVFASSLGRQVSYEKDELGHGAFTYALLEGLGQGKADLDTGAGKDGLINVEELLTYLRGRVPALTGGAQLPACPLLRDFGEPFPLAQAPVGAAQ